MAPKICTVLSYFFQLFGRTEVCIFAAIWPCLVILLKKWPLFPEFNNLNNFRNLIYLIHTSTPSLTNVKLRFHGTFAGNACKRNVVEDQLFGTKESDGSCGSS